MQLIPFSAARAWSTLGVYGARTPSSISTICPFCNERGIFTMYGHIDDQERNSICMSGNCPSCQKTAYFWALREKRKPLAGEESGNPSAIFMYPAGVNYYPHPAFLSDLPEPLQRSFVSTVDALNSQNHAATAVCARRTLEGIFKYLVPEDKRKQTLAKLIDSVKETNDLAAPLKSLSHAIRDGGNLGAHFDMEREPNAEIAKQMVELLEYLISYLYVLPKEIGKLESSLSGDV